MQFRAVLQVWASLLGGVVLAAAHQETIERRPTAMTIFAPHLEPRRCRHGPRGAPMKRTFRCGHPWTHIRTAGPGRSWNATFTSGSPHPVCASRPPRCHSQSRRPLPETYEASHDPSLPNNAPAHATPWRNSTLFCAQAATSIFETFPFALARRVIRPTDWSRSPEWIYPVVLAAAPVDRCDGRPRRAGARGAGPYEVTCPIADADCDEASGTASSPRRCRRRLRRFSSGLSA